MTRISSPCDHLHQFKDSMLSCKQDYKQCCAKLSICLDSIACRTNVSSKNVEVIFFCMTLSVSHTVVEQFWPTLLYVVASVHSGLQGFVYAQLSDPTMTFQLD